MRRTVAALLVATLALLTAPAASAGYTDVELCDDGGVTVTVNSNNVLTCYRADGPEDVFRVESCHGGAGFRYVILDGFYTSPCHV